MRNRHGFTLIELLVSSSMLVLLASAGYAVLSAGVQSSQKVRRVGAMVAHGQRAMSLMAADIRSAVEYEDVRLMALDTDYDGAASDTIDFLAPCSRRGQLEPGAGSLCEVGYYIDNDPGTEAQWLLRRQDETLDDDPLEGGTLALAAPFVSELNLTFFDGVEWLDGWEGGEELPRAVHITIVVLDEDEAEAPLCLETTVSIVTVSTATQSMARE